MTFELREGASAVSCQWVLQYVRQDLQSRSCTDVRCCILFSLCIMGLAICSGLGYLHGNPKLLIYPIDSGGHSCGYGALKARPFLFFFDLLQCARAATNIATGCPTRTVCVSKCPTTYFTYQLSLQAAVSNGKARFGEQQVRRNMICKHDVDPVSSKETIQQLVWSEKCAAYYVPSTAVNGRCVPSEFSHVNSTQQTITAESVPLVTAFGETLTYEKLANGTRYLQLFYSLTGYDELLFRDMVLSWSHILLLLVAVMLVCMLWVFLLQIITQPLIWVSLIIFIILSSYCAYYSHSRYVKLATDSKDILPDPYISNSLHHRALKITWLVVAYVLSIVVILFLLLHIFLLKKIKPACLLIKQASRILDKMPMIILWPLIPFAMQLVLTAYYLSSAIHISAVGEREYYKGNYTNITEVVQNRDYNALLSRVPCDPDNRTEEELCNFVRHSSSRIMPFVEIYLLVMFIWLLNFIVTLGQMTLAGVFAVSYWSIEKDQDFSVFIFTSLWRCLRYNLGSLALGSFIMIVVLPVRPLLDYMDFKLMRGPTFLTKVLRYLPCCLWSTEHILKYIQKNAFIVVAMSGRDFCSSSKEAFETIKRNRKRIVVVDKVSNFLLIVGKLTLMAASGVAACRWFVEKNTSSRDDNQELTYAIVPVIVILIGSLSIVSSFFSVFDTAVDTVFLCFLEDLERNDGSSGQSSSLMSRSLLKLLHKGWAFDNPQGTTIEDLSETGDLSRTSSVSTQDQMPQQDRFQPIWSIISYARSFFRDVFVDETDLDGPEPTRGGPSATDRSGQSLRSCRQGYRS